MICMYSKTICGYFVIFVKKGTLMKEIMASR